MDINSVDLTNIKNYAGTYAGSLLKRLYLELALGATGISVMPGLKSKHTLHKIFKKKGLKPYTGTEAPRGGSITYEPRVLQVEKAQHDDMIHPSDYIGTYMEQMRGRGESPNNKTIPFQQVVMETVMDETADEIVRDTIYNGVGKSGFAAYNAGTAYTVGSLITYTQEGELRYWRCIAATTAGQTPDTHPAKWEWAGGRALCKGLGKIIADEVTAGNIKAAQVINTGAITSADAYGQFTAVWRGLPEIIRSKGATIHTSFTNHEFLMDDYENKIKKNFEQVDGITYLAKTDRKCQILPVNWLSGAGRLIATPGSNLWMGTDQASDLNALKVIEKMYTLQLGMSFMIGFQIADLEVLAINDQA